MLLVAFGLAILWRQGRTARSPLLLVTIPFLVLLASSIGPIEYIFLGSLEWQNAPLEERPEDVRAIVVLASAVRPANPWRQRPELDDRTIYRCLCAVALYSQGKPCPIVVSGGKSGPSEPDPPCAHTMRDFLMELGVQKSAILVEDSSRSTYENAVQCRGMRDLRGINHIVLVTDAVHMARAARCFRKQGFEVVPSACHYEATNYTPGWQDIIPSLAAARNCERVWHEWIGIAWYWFSGRL